MTFHGYWWIKVIVVGGSKAKTHFEAIPNRYLTKLLALVSYPCEESYLESSGGFFFLNLVPYHSCYNRTT